MDASEHRQQMVEQGELWDSKTSDLRWFHVMREMIRDGSIGRMGPPAWAVYSVIKGYADIATGISQPTTATIARLISMSEDTVYRALETLVKGGWITTERQGRRNVYKLKETTRIYEPTGEEFAVAKHNYVPKGFGKALEQIKRYVESGDLPQGVPLTINVTFNVQQITQGDGGTVTMNVRSIQGAPAPSASPPLISGSGSGTRPRVGRSDDPVDVMAKNYLL